MRAFGSSLERRLSLHEAEDGGADVMVMHVQADASSRIEHYTENTGDVTFILLGYWECGTYANIAGLAARPIKGEWGIFTGERRHWLNTSRFSASIPPARKRSRGWLNC
ncbi:MAG: hypothetical protein IH789_13465 [Acidobacteria bacterium]|nr:hypothetical protein [Acidobacteriota bacterium]